MLEKGTLIIVKWQTKQCILQVPERGDLKPLKKENVSAFTVGWVVEHTENLLLILLHCTTGDENLIFTIEKKDIANITVLQDAKDCPFKES